MAGSAPGLVPSWLTDVSGFSSDRLLARLRRRSSDFLAGLTGGLASVPDGMAASVIVGVPPVHGLYASIFGPIIGGLTSRTALLIITTTSAAALAASETLSGVDPDQRVAALLVITFLAGLFQVAASLLGLARLTSFVSHSVMTGFLSGVAVLIVLGQLGTLVGYKGEGSNTVLRSVDVLRHAGSFDPATLTLGLIAIALIVASRRTGLKTIGPILALVVPSIVAAAAGLSDVETVRDVSVIPSSIPTPALPDFKIVNFSLVTGSLALAAIVFVQSAGVTQAMPGRSDVKTQGRDLAASGLANIGASLFEGQPVGGSLGQSAINVQGGARTRLAGIMSGVWVLLVILFLSSLVEQVVMTALAAILIVASLGALDSQEARSIWETSWSARLSILATFVLTLVLPIQVAVLAGVLLSILLHVFTAASDVRVVALVQEEGGLREAAPPEHLDSDSVTILQVYGSIFFAGARTLASRLPRIGEATHAAVILRLRGKTAVGATAIDVLSDYATELKDHKGRLYIAGLTPELRGQLKRSGKLQLTGVRLFPASRLQGRSVARSYRAANTWLVRSRDDVEDDE